jgi:hypothetical protein
MQETNMPIEEEKGDNSIHHANDKSFKTAIIYHHHKQKAL